MSVKTQGTMLYFLDPDTQLPVKVGCVTSINGISVPRDQIEITCLDDLARRYMAGMATPGNMTFGINFDPGDTSHLRLHELYVDGTTIEWAIGWSDGTTAPTADTSGLVMANSRSWLNLEGYISDLPFDFALNSAVASTVSVQVSGFPAVLAKAA